MNHFAFGLVLLLSWEVRADDAFFTEKVQPILVQRCLECHSHEGKIKGGLVLDARSGWEIGGDSGPAVVPGKVEESLLIQAVTYAKPDYEMPPKGKLPEEEIAILKQWVAMGAPDPRKGGNSTAKNGIDLEAGRQFWSFRPVRKPDVPKVRDTEWPRNDIDRFILAKLEAAGLTPAPDADEMRFRRRLSYDLTGLPPSQSKGESQESIQAILGSRQFAERWARHWLDLARCADSNGSSFQSAPPHGVALPKLGH
jgi:hypothetical protein